MAYLASCAVWLFPSMPLREEVRSLGEVRGIDPAYLDMFPIIFTDNATLADCNTVDAEGVGAVLRTEHKAQLDRFIKTFKGCHKRAENGSEQLIKLEIRGYSSTATFSYKPDFPFQCSPMTPELSDRLNTDAANIRAANVKDYLEDELARQHIQDSFKIDLKKWDTYDDIRRPYFDSREHPELDAPELINRSVFIRVTDAGACDV